jgi:putative oxidoreductase
VGVESSGHFPTIDLGYALQRLYSIFPNSWPGFGLLLLRGGLSSRLIFIAICDLSTRPSEPIVLAPSLVAVAGGIFLLAGLWTPITGVLLALDEVWFAFSLHSPGQEHTWTHVCLAVICVSLAMLGPGAWSIDARLYGRWRFPSDRSRGNRPSP